VANATSSQNGTDPVIDQSDGSTASDSSGDVAPDNSTATTSDQSGNSTDSSTATTTCDVDSANKRGGAVCVENSDCLSDKCVAGATSQDCSRCCGQHPPGTCTSGGNGCGQYSGCRLDLPFTVAGEVIPGCFKCTGPPNGEEEMDMIDTPSLRASFILKDE
jgi:hypothetical protein